MRKLVLLVVLALPAAVAEDLQATLDARGQVEFNAGRYQSARDYFKRALDAPTVHTAGRASTLGNAGLACLALGDNRQAELYFREGIGLMPRHAGLWHGLGQALVPQKKLKEAESAYRKALQSEDPRPQVWSDLALLLETERRRPEAIALLQEAIASSPKGQGRARMLANLGVFEWKAGIRQGAADHLRQALTEMEETVGTAHPDVARILVDYAIVLRETGDKARSRDAARRAESIRSAFAAQDGSGTVGWRELRK
jgi:tetratricopeptide (TPR) repeat protein